MSCKQLFNFATIVLVTALAQWVTRWRTLTVQCLVMALSADLYIFFISWNPTPVTVRIRKALDKNFKEKKRNNRTTRDFCKVTLSMTPPCVNHIVSYIILICKKAIWSKTQYLQVVQTDLSKICWKFLSRTPVLLLWLLYVCTCVKIIWSYPTLSKFPNKTVFSLYAIPDCGGRIPTWVDSKTSSGPYQLPCISEFLNISDSFNFDALKNC